MYRVIDSQQNGSSQYSYQASTKLSFNISKDKIRVDDCYFKKTEPQTGRLSPNLTAPTVYTCTGSQVLTATNLAAIADEQDCEDLSYSKYPPSESETSEQHDEVPFDLEDQLKKV